MMGLGEMLMLGLALAMDCFTVSITCGIMQRRMGRQVWAMALLFGTFQAAMPLAGWLAAELFSKQIEAFDHWIAFGLLALLGLKMIKEGFSSNQECTFLPSRPLTLLTLAVATSIDALAVGVSFVGMGILTWGAVLPPIAVIGVVSLAMSFIGKYLGTKIGRRLRFSPEPVGGIILLCIGVKVLVEHLSA